MTKARLAQRRLQKLAVNIYVRASAAEFDFSTLPKKEIDQNGITEQSTSALDSSLCGNRAKPGQAGPGRAEPGRAGTPARAGSRPAARFG